MNRKIVGVFALVFAFVLGFVLLANQPAAQGQKPEKAPQWEYKIYKATDADLAGNKVDAEFNKFATEGWEFVKTLVSRVHQPGPVAGGPSPLAGTTCVLFKRLKK